jgi:hypothetical protein
VAALVHPASSRGVAEGTPIAQTVDAAAADAGGPAKALPPGPVVVLGLALALAAVRRLRA